MGKVIAIHEIRLHRGVDPGEFERFAAEPLPSPAGMRAYMARADRGARAGAYVFVIEFDSAEQRDLLFPKIDTPDTNPETRRWLESPPVREFFTRLDTFGSGLTQQDVYTDYVALST